MPTFGSLIGTILKTMKKVLLFTVAALCSVVAYAQKEVKFQDTQARLLDVSSNAYVKPLTVELKVMSEKHISEVIKLTAQDVRDMNGDIANIRSFAVYRASRLHDCDVIVAATFNIHSVPEGIEVNIIGYPANFVNWKTASQADYEWIRMEKTITTDEREKIAAAIKR
jgi:hypothetical protein